MRQTGNGCHAQIMGKTHPTRLQVNPIHCAMKAPPNEVPDILKTLGTASRVTVNTEQCGFTASLGQTT